MRLLLIILGWVCTALAVLGILLPLLPTVPLLLLAVACFARSSERFHQWLLNHPRLGPLVRTYADGRGMPRRAKFSAIGLLWLSIGLSLLLVGSRPWLALLLILVACGVTLYLLRLPVTVSRDG